jgi:hypothetical protein
MKTLALRDDEKTGLMNDASVSTLTFYSGRASESWLRTRVGEIVRQNPVLAGRLVSSPAGPQVEYCEDPGGTASALCFAVVDGPAAAAIVPATGYDDLAMACKPYTAKSGRECLDKPASDATGSLFRVTLFQQQDGAHKSALLVSMPHVLGDAHTFYRLYAMLDKSANPAELSARLCWERQRDFLTRKAGLFDADAVACIQSAAAGEGFARNFKTPVKHVLYDVDAKCIEERKRVESTRHPDVTWVSTNDIITAWYFAQRAAAANLMVMNLRPRLRELMNLNDENMGNYQDSLLYGPLDGTLPHQIRLSLSSQATSGVLKGFSMLPGADELRQGGTALVTNWSCFYVEVELGECQHLMHMPIYGADCGVGGCLLVFNKCCGQLSALHRARNHDAGLLHTLEASPFLPFTPSLTHTT